MSNRAWWLGNLSCSQCNQLNGLTVLIWPFHVSVWPPSKPHSRASLLQQIWAVRIQPYWYSSSPPSSYYLLTAVLLKEAKSWFKNKVVTMIFVWLVRWHLKPALKMQITIEGTHHWCRSYMAPYIYLISSGTEYPFWATRFHDDNRVSYSWRQPLVSVWCDPHQESWEPWGNYFQTSSPLLISRILLSLLSIQQYIHIPSVLVWGAWQRTWGFKGKNQHAFSS